GKRGQREGAPVDRCRDGLTRHPIQPANQVIEPTPPEKNPGAAHHYRSRHRNNAMKRGPALVLAAFTIWPIVYISLMLILMYATVMTGRDYLPVGGTDQNSFKILFNLHLLTMLDIGVLFVIYLRYLFNSRNVPHAKRGLWAVVLFCANALAMPVFWYLYIWKPIRGREPGPSAYPATRVR
ncbi:MAG: hypothetical protein V1873_04720, partial [Verrucomicrobiota bacterium]